MATKYELSKTYQYRKVMKPLLERKRRARINKCLDELKDLMAECLEQNGDAKFEKADILEVTVQHLRKLKAQKQQKQNSSSPVHQPEQSFRAGYIRAANEVSRCLAALPKIDVSFGTSLMTHLGMRLNQLECAEPQIQRLEINAPLSISCGSSDSSTTNAAGAFSPVSSGYASDSDCSSMRSTPSDIYNNNNNNNNKKSLLQVTSIAAPNSPVWRPW